MRALWLGWTLLAFPAAYAAPGSGNNAGFVVYSVDASGGGWVIHHLPGRGDTLWGCRDVAAVPQACIQVFFEAWRTGSNLEFLHIEKTSQSAWLRLNAPGWGDDLLACRDPLSRPVCTRVALRDKPDKALISRAWPQKPDPTDPLAVIEPASRSDMWLQAGPPGSGPLNLYACTGLLKDAPRCRLGLPNLLRIDREAIGWRRLEDIRPTRGGPSTGARVVKVDEGSAAWDAGLRPDMVIVGIGGFPATDSTKILNIAAQYPAQTPFSVELEGGTELQITPRQRSTRAGASP